MFWTGYRVQKVLLFYTAPSVFLFLLLPKKHLVMTHLTVSYSSTDYWRASILPSSSHPNWQMITWIQGSAARELNFLSDPDWVVRAVLATSCRAVHTPRFYYHGNQYLLLLTEVCTLHNQCHVMRRKPRVGQNGSYVESSSKDHLRSLFLGPFPQRSHC